MRLSSDHHTQTSVVDKPTVGHAEKHEYRVHSIAERGIVATDQYGHSLVQIDRAAEARLRRKIDLYIVPTVAMLYLFCFIDRANIGNARLAGFEKDLGLEGYDYNAVLSCFYISYIIFEIPANALCKWVGPGWFLPATTLGFGIVTVGFAYVGSFSAACGVRFLLGILECGLLPGIAYYLSRWYRRSELAWRISLYIVMAPLAGAFGGLLASGILTLDRFGNTHTWQMIFAVEGIITIGLALIAFVTVTDRPETARWLNQEEKDLAIARIKSERVATTELLDKFDRPKFLRGVLNPLTLTNGFMFLLGNISAQSLAFFAPTIIRSIYPTHTVISQQLHTVPPYVVGSFFVLLLAGLSWKLDKRNILIIFSAPPMMVGYIMFLASENSSVRYGGMIIAAAGAFATGTLCTAAVSANVVSDTARSSAIGTVVMMGNIGGLIATWAFPPFDGPNYRIGNGLNLGTSALILITASLLGFWMKHNNKKRDQKDVETSLDGLTEKEVQDLDWKHPGFRWRP